MQMEMRHLLMQRRAFERRTRRQEVQLVGLRNEVRGFAGEDPIDPYDTPSRAQSIDKDEEARRVLLRQIDVDDG